jgi:hypothetical protein
LIDEALLPIDIEAMGRGQVLLETVYNWITYLGRAYEEMRQFAAVPTEYLGSFWNRIDFVLVIVQSVALILWFYTIQQFSERGCEGDQSDPTIDPALQ